MSGESEVIARGEMRSSFIDQPEVIKVARNVYLCLEPRPQVDTTAPFRILSRKILIRGRLNLRPTAI